MCSALIQAKPQENTIGKWVLIYRYTQGDEISFPGKGQDGLMCLNLHTRGSFRSPHYSQALLKVSPSAGSIAPKCLLVDRKSGKPSRQGGGRGRHGHRNF